MLKGVFYLLGGTSICLGTTAAMAEEPAGATQAVAPGDIVVTGVADPQSAAATGLKLTLSETPQSVTIVDQQRIRDFQLTSANDLLDQVVGINVERAETDRTAVAWAAIPLVSWWSIGIPDRAIGWGFDIVSFLSAAACLIVLRRLRRGVSGLPA